MIKSLHLNLIFSFAVEKNNLEQWRVSNEGFKNRYRGNADKAPHTDNIYKIMYPNDSNEDYTCNEIRNNRLENVQMSKFEIRRRVNGDFDMKVLMDKTVPEVVPQ